ncbi:pentapeptide repeat protein [Calothrix parasitica NIES-267]|uniref:Pentapeptide repeat protein n=1 Tax=Calothrix parasitica NIES-267 TaxID=1973488 RepID=A0A1Z4LMY7_9CYAN|nr:pentapeptide repeat protein [Calothrix parasitica NIES-267]
MTNNQNQPNKYDAVLGGNSPPPIHGAVLGGIEGVKKRLLSSDVDVQISALNDALNYGDVGLDLVIEALENESEKIRNHAYKALIFKNEPKINTILKNYRYWDFWDLRERISEPLNNGYIFQDFKIFSNRKVEYFDQKSVISNPLNKAYVIDYDGFDALIKQPLASEIESLIFKFDYDSDFIVSENILTNLKAVFAGGYGNNYEISWIDIPNIGFILKNYPNLEMLQLRGGDDNYIHNMRGNYERYYPNNWQDIFELKHDKLKALIIETGGLGCEKIANILSTKLSSLEHFELWLGNEEYGGNSSINDLMPLLSGELFPNLTYLGLRNSEYADDIATAIVNSPIINRIQVLDLSMGNLGDEGAEALLNSPAVNDLAILNVSDSCISDEMFDNLNNLDVEVFAQTDKYPGDRYCSVTE